MHGKTIKQLRENRGWTQEDLGEKLGKSAPYISRIENGDRVGTLVMARKFAVAFDVPVQIILEGGDLETTTTHQVPPEVATLVARIALHCRDRHLDYSGPDLAAIVDLLADDVADLSEVTDREIAIAAKVIIQA